MTTKFNRLTSCKALSNNCASSSNGHQIWSTISQYDTLMDYEGQSEMGATETNIAFLSKNNGECRWRYAYNLQMQLSPI